MKIFRKRLYVYDELGRRGRLFVNSEFESSVEELGLWLRTDVPLFLGSGEYVCNMDEVDSSEYRVHSLFWVILLVVVMFCGGCTVYKSFDF